MNSSWIACSPFSYDLYSNNSTRGTIPQHIAASFSLMDFISEYIGVTITYREPIDREWGSRTENGTWTGCVAEIIAGSADIGAAPFSITEERYHVVDFTIPFVSEARGFVMKNLEAKQVTNSFWDLFDASLWVGLSICAVLLSCLLYNVKDCLQSFVIEAGASRNNISFFLLWTFGAIVKQTCNWSPKSLHLKFITLIWTVIGINLSFVYTSNLISFLANRDTRPAINSFKELSNSNGYKVALVKGSAQDQYFMEERTDMTQKIGNMIKSNPNGLPSNLYEGLRRMQNGIDDVFIAPVAVLKDYMSKTSGLVIAKDTVYQTYCGFIVKKNSSHLGKLNPIISKAVESGFFQHWLSRYGANLRKHPPENDSSMWRVDLPAMISPLFALLLGVTAASFIFVGEILSFIYGVWTSFRAGLCALSQHRVI